MSQASGESSFFRQTLGLSGYHVIARRESRGSYTGDKLSQKVCLSPVFLLIIPKNPKWHEPFQYVRGGPGIMYLRKYCVRGDVQRFVQWSGETARFKQHIYSEEGSHATSSSELVAYLSTLGCFVCPSNSSQSTRAHRPLHFESQELTFWSESWSSSIRDHANNRDVPGRIKLS